MRLSHSSLTCILNCPYEYYLAHVIGLTPKVGKDALEIGSAVHWGIEHDTEDLSEYFEQNFRTANNYTKNQLLSESMVHGYLKNKDYIFTSLLYDEESQQTLDMLEEIHEYRIEVPVESKIETEGNIFVGIIDLLIKTPKGFILVDYKTSSQIPDWDGYLDQIYRYIFLLGIKFPDIPVYKIAIINIKKSQIRIKAGESQESFLRRLKLEYDINDSDLVCYHIYEKDKLNQQYIDEYIKNLKVMCDTAAMINMCGLYYINYSTAVGKYGKSQFYDIYYNTDGAYTLYNIKDEIYDEYDEKLVDVRPCTQFDIDNLQNNKVLNKYKLYEKERKENIDLVYPDFIDYLKDKYTCDDSLLEIYNVTFCAKN